MRRVCSALILCLVFCTLQVKAEESIYKYRDDTGAVYYVDKVSKIPQRYRSANMQPHDLPELIRERDLQVSGNSSGASTRPTRETKEPIRSGAWQFQSSNKSLFSLSAINTRTERYRELLSPGQEQMMQSLGLGFFVLSSVFTLLWLCTYWILFARAGLPGWGILVPFYNFVLMSRLADKSGWWTLWILFPVLGAILWSASTSYLTARRFGRSEGFAILSIFFPFISFPLMAFFPR